MKLLQKHARALLWVAAALALLAAAGGSYVLYVLGTRLGALADATEVRLSAIEQKSLELSDTLYAAQQSVAAIQNRLGGFEEEVGTISGTVGTLQKLSKTDPELLQKYSKVFFLNEHYAPERLAVIDKEFTYDESRPEKISVPVWSYLKDLLESAHADDVELYVKSAYRSFEEQKSLKSAYSVTYGSGTANQFSADQGYSEHQLGTTVDFITTGLDGQLRGFEGTAAYTWLLEHAHEYGFVLSYPPNNAHYIFEPWHWRFVGATLATDLHEDGMYFYDLEQREIDEYLVSIFD
jgi:LAS superfamily LD-carboxypeptidase LdcB